VTAPAGETLEALVEHELRGPIHELVTRLVPRLVAEGLAALALANGDVTATRDAAVKACRGCGQSKPIGEYETGRAVCRQCRRGQVRERAARRAEADRAG
jgi:hypothetical protein